MQQTRFMVLTGHLNDYPLPDLVGILRHQRKTGRLLIEYPVGPSSFFFKDGELVDVQLGELSGIQAVCIAISQPNASFNFNPLVLPSAQSIDNSLQKVVTQLLDCWDDETPATEVKSVGEGRTANAFLPPSTSDEFINAERVLPDSDNILSLPPSPAAEAATTTSARSIVKRRKQALFAGAALVLLLIVPAVIALTTNSLRRREARTSANSPAIEVKENSTNAAPNFSVSSQNETPPDASSNATATTILNNITREERRTPREQFRTETGAAKRNETIAPLAAAPSPSSSAPTESEAGAAAARRQNAVASPAASTTSSATSASAASGEQTPTVVLQVENGRVTGANIANRRPGMEAFEASALRIARQRRFPANTTGTVTMRIKVTQQK
ncbi:MAG: DUF4388 domain-containing protein [Pyrinomonadaceae bacterium]|nr:DUF4388 domain-containing protein [Pyrinomonadaceae bacterium]